MLLAKGDLWTIPSRVILVTTNGCLDRKGRAVMGAGVALQCKNRYPKLPEMLGSRIADTGNHSYLFIGDEKIIITFPTKHKWWEPSDIKLIERSAQEIEILVNRYQLTRIVGTAPGCGNGMLDWATVKPVIEQYFDDRFTILVKE